MKFWLGLLLLEILAGVNAGLVFRIFDRPIAGLVAGGVFTFVGIAALWGFFKRAQRFRRLGLGVAIVYLFGAALPLWIFRLTTPLNEDLNSIFGIPLSVFHRLSETFYLLLIVVTVMQLAFRPSSLPTSLPK